MEHGVSGAGHLDLSYGDEAQALAESVRGFVNRWADEGEDEPGALPARLWKGLAELGVLGLATPEGGGGVQEIAAVMEVLGAAAAPGPLVGTFMATQLAGPAGRARLASGDHVASIGSPPLLPWAPVADVFVELAPDGAWLARPAGDIEPVDTLAGEPWGRVGLERMEPVEEAVRRRAVAVGDTAVAAYLAGAAGHLVAITSQWLRDRVQFGRPIAEFQSLAHPLADVEIRTRAARALARTAAYTVDTTPDGAGAPAATARLSATRAAVDATYRAHQSFGALGFTVEGPVARVGQRVRQVSLHPPGPAAARQTALATAGL
jgi:alkylation response protein AidB-like acyl-CoA dehydrogenase